MTAFPSKLTRGESYTVKSSGLKFSSLYRSGYIISTPLPWLTITLFTSYPLILSVTTKASLWGCMVPILSSFEKLSAGWISTIALFGSRLLYSADSRVTDITLEGQESILPGVAKMTLIIPRGGLEEASFRGSEPVWLLWLLE